MATIVVFQTERERAMLGSDVGHDWQNQKKIFGTETKQLLEACDKLFRSSLDFQKAESNQQLRKIYGIAKRHGLYVTWYGKDCEPDRFLVSGKGYERLAFIQC